MSAHAPRNRITPAQARILTAYAQGGTYTQIAARLNLTYWTVINTLNNARRRTGATTNVHLLALAIHAGDIDPDCAHGTAVHP